jgi:hypothetical protein
MHNKEPGGTDIVVALAFLACVAFGTWWFSTIVSEAFAAAIMQHMLQFPPITGR